MHAPDASTLRPGDYVNVRGAAGIEGSGPGRRGLVIAAHPTAVEVRFSINERNVRLDLSGPGEMVRFGNRFPDPLPEPVPVPVAAPRPGPGRFLLGGGLVLLVLAFVLVWGQGSQPVRSAAADPNKAATGSSTHGSGSAGSGGTAREGGSTTTGGTARPSSIPGVASTRAGAGDPTTATCPGQDQPQTLASPSPEGASPAATSGATSCTAHQSPRAEPQSASSSSR